MSMKPWHHAAWIVILLVDVGLLAWGAMAALLPERLPGPDSTPILSAGYENFTGGSWSELMSTSPMVAAFITLLFRMYGIYIVAFGLPAIAITVTAFRQAIVEHMGVPGREHDRIRLGNDV